MVQTREEKIQTVRTKYGGKVIIDDEDNLFTNQRHRNKDTKLKANMELISRRCQKTVICHCQTSQDSEDSFLLLKSILPLYYLRARHYPFQFPVVKMKLELCSYSGYKIYPGHGKRLVKADGRTFYFLNHKCERSHIMKRNPRNINWTVLYRRKHKKGQVDEIAKRRTRRTQKFQRAITGATLNDIIAKRNQKPEVRKAQREQAIRAYKEKVKVKEAQKKTTKPAPAKQPKQAKAAKQPMTKAPRVGGKR
ncbi:60S ribosomal protein L24 [Bulinus truncatus]|nr:60S ribosomal protein L24 [Bulinus truncatus]